MLVSHLSPNLPVKHTDTRQLSALPFGEIAFKGRVHRIHQCTNDRDFVLGTRKVLLLLQVDILFVSKQTNKRGDNDGGSRDTTVGTCVFLEESLNGTLGSLEGMVIKTTWMGCQWLRVSRLCVADRKAYVTSRTLEG